MNISDNYVDLLERVITENRELRDTMKTQNEKQEKMFNDLMAKLNQPGINATEGAEGSRKSSKRKQKLTVPPLCRAEFRKMYKILKEGDDFGGFVFTESYGTGKNQQIIKKVLKAIDEDHAGKCPWSAAQLKGAGATYFKSKKDENSHKIKNQVEEHKTICRRQGRMRDKLQRRIEALENLVETTEENKSKIRKALTLEYTSSDESDISDDEEGGGTTLKGYLVKKLPWEKGMLRKLKKQLDNTYYNNLPARSKRNILPRSSHTQLSARPIPSVIFKWAVREINISQLNLSFSPAVTSTPK